jgi:hypothetical protein
VGHDRLLENGARVGISRAIRGHQSPWFELPVPGSR